MPADTKSISTSSDTIQLLEKKLALCALEFRTNKHNAFKRKEAIKTYNEVVYELFQSDEWSRTIDPDCQLPDKYMPEIYKKRWITTAASAELREMAEKLAQHELLEQYKAYLDPGRQDADWELFRVADRYSIVRILGKGGMACVFLAVDEKMCKRVALTVPLPEKLRDPTTKKRYKREVKLLKKLGDNLGIVRFYESATTKKSPNSAEVPFLCMEYVPGCTIKEKLAVWHRLPQVEVIRIAIETCSRLSLIHDHGAHRDIKPGNLMLDILHSGSVRIVDFGLAFSPEDLEDALSKGHPVGTPRYIAPERLEHPHRYAAYAASDLYSLGCTVYEMLVGHPPFEETTLTSLIQAILTKLPRSPADILGDSVSPKLSDLVMRLLEKEPRQRPQTAAELKKEFESVLESALDNIGDSPADWPNLSKEEVFRALRQLGASSLDIPHEWCEGDPGILFGLAMRKQLSLSIFNKVYESSDKLLTLQFDVTRRDLAEISKSLDLMKILLKDTIALCDQCVAASEGLNNFAGNVGNVRKVVVDFIDEINAWKNVSSKCTNDNEVDWDNLQKKVSHCIGELLCAEVDFINDQVFVADLLLAATERVRRATQRPAG